MTDHLLTAAVLSLGIGTAAWIITSAKISQNPRVWVVRRGASNRFAKWFGELINCPACTGTWLAFGATAIYRPWLVRMFWPTDFLVTAFAMMPLAMIVVWIFKKALAK